MSEQTKPNQVQQETELTDETLEQATGGTAMKTEEGISLTDEPPTEEVAFYYNKIAFRYAKTPD